MSAINLLSEIITKKIRRQQKLNDLHDELEELTLELRIKGFRRWFGTVYFRMKRIITLFISLIAIILGTYYFIFPDSAYDKASVHQVVAKELNGMQRSHSINGNVMAIIQNQVTDFITETLSYAIRIGAALLTSFGFMLLYISRLSKKMKKMSIKITESEKFTRKVIEVFQKTIKEEEQELVKLQNMLSEQPR